MVAKDVNGKKTGYREQGISVHFSSDNLSKRAQNIAQKNWGDSRLTDKEKK